MALAALVVRIGSDLTGLNKGLNQAEKDVKRVGKNLARLGSDLTQNLTLPIIAAGAALVASAVHVGTFADTLLDLVDQTGLSSDALQEFRHVATVAGVESDTLATAAIKLTTALQSGDEQTKQLTDALGRLGLSAKDSSGRLRSMDTLLPSIIGKLQGMTDLTTRNTIAADIFGRSWAELAPILGLGAGAMAAAQKEARTLGLVLSAESVAAADAFRQKLDTLKASAGAVTREIGIAVLPVMTRLVGFLQTEVVPAVRSVVQWFDNLSPATKTAIGVVAGLAAAFGPLLVAVGTIMSFWPLLTAAFTALLGPIGLTIAAVGSLALAGMQMVKHWDAVKLQFTLAWTAMKDAVFFVVDKILNAVAGMARTFKMHGLANEITLLAVNLRLLADEHLANAGGKIAALELKMDSAAAATTKAAGAVATLGKAIAALPDPVGEFGSSNRPEGMFGPEAGSKGGRQFADFATNLGQQFASKFGGAFSGLFSGLFSGNLVGAAASGVMGLVDGIFNMGEKARQAREAFRQFTQGMDAFIDRMKVDLGILGGDEAAKNARQRDLDDRRRALQEQIRKGELGIAGSTPGWAQMSQQQRDAILASRSSPALRALREQLAELDRVGDEWVQGVDRATDAVNKFADALSNIPRVLNINALRHMVTGSPVSPFHRGGGRPTLTGNVYITVPGAGDPAAVAEAVGMTVQRLAGRGSVSRLALATT